MSTHPAELFAGGQHRHPVHTSNGWNATVAAGSTFCSFCSAAGDEDDDRVRYSTLFSGTYEENSGGDEEPLAMATAADNWKRRIRMREAAARGTRPGGGGAMSGVRPKLGLFL